jgi:starch synthase (maltosyl-transferring)
MPHDAQYEAHDLISDERYLWSGGSQYVKLDPARESAHILHLRRWEHIDYAEPDA